MTEAKKIMTEAKKITKNEIKKVLEGLKKKEISEGDCIGIMLSCIASGIIDTNAQLTRIATALENDNNKLGFVIQREKPTDATAKTDNPTGEDGIPINKDQK